MTNTTGHTIAGPIVPYTQEDTYPTHFSQYGAGGLTYSIGISGLNQVPFDRQENGMLVYVLDYGTGEYYKLINKRDPYALIQSGDWSMVNGMSITGIQLYVAGVTSINLQQGIIYFSGQSGIIVDNSGQNFYVKNDLNYLKNFFDQIYYNISNPNQYATSGDLLSFITQSGADLLYYGINNPSGFVTLSGTDNLYYPLNSNPSGYLTVAISTGTFVTRAETGQFASVDWATGNFYPLNSNPSGYLTAAMSTGTFVTRAETGQFAATEWVTNNFYPMNNPSGFMSAATGSELFYPLKSNPSGYLTNVNISGLVPRNETGDLVSTQLGATLYYPLNANPADYISMATGDAKYYPLNANPSGYLTEAISSGTFVTRNETGQFASANWVSGNFYLSNNPSGYLSTGNIHGTGYIHVTRENDIFYVSGEEIRRIEQTIAQSNSFETGDSVTFYYVPSLSQYRYRLAIASGTIQDAYAVGIIEACASDWFRIIYQGRINEVFDGALQSGQLYYLAHDQYGKLRSAPPPPTNQYWKKPMLLATSENGGIVLANQPIVASTVSSGELTGLFYPLNSNPSGYASTGWVYEYAYPLNQNPSGYLTTGQTGDFASTGWVNQYYYSKENPSGFTTTGITNQLYYPIGNPSGFTTTGETSTLYYSINNPSGYLNSINDEINILIEKPRNKVYGIDCSAGFDYNFIDSIVGITRGGTGTVYFRRYVDGSNYNNAFTSIATMAITTMNEYYTGTLLTNTINSGNCFALVTSGFTTTQNSDLSLRIKIRHY